MIEELEEAAREIKTALRQEARELQLRFAKWLYRLGQRTKPPELRDPDWQ